MKAWVFLLLATGAANALAETTFDEFVTEMGKSFSIWHWLIILALVIGTGGLRNNKKGD